jgi:hypothetical protein
MALRSFLYLLGASLTVAGCFFPWSCRQVGDLSWRCSTAIVLRYSIQDEHISHLDIYDHVQGSGFIILFLTVMIVCFAFFPPRFIHRPKRVAVVTSAALAIVSAYHFTATLMARLQDSDAFAAFASLTSAIMCIGAILTLVAGGIDQRATHE